jgi:hypothetical protein
MTQSVDRLLTVLLVLLLLASAAAALPGLYLVGSDLQTSGEFLDGIGVVLGLGMVGLATVPAAAAVMAIRTLRRGRPSARRWVVGAGVLGACAVLPFGFFHQPLLAVLVLPVLLVVVAALDDGTPA